jgi:hypothetical protein
LRERERRDRERFREPLRRRERRFPNPTSS